MELRPFFMPLFTHLLDRWSSGQEDRPTLTQQHEEKNVRSLAESAIFYVGIPAALLYPLGVLGVGLQIGEGPCHSSFA
jgi:hypothetical protein